MNENILAILFTSGLGAGLGAAVAIALLPRQIAVKDVGMAAELASAMNELAQELVRVKMRTVRASVKEAAAQPAAQNAIPFPLTKEQLRAMARAKQNGGLQ